MTQSMKGSSYNVSEFTRLNVSCGTSDIKYFIDEFRKRELKCLQREEQCVKNEFKSFAEKRISLDEISWLKDNTERFFDHTANKTLVKVHYLSECGFICSMIYSADGEHIIVGHSTGLVQMRHGSTGAVLATLRNIQFPPKPVHALEYSQTEPNICYAACLDGAVYRIDIPHIDTSVTDPPAHCIRADPMLESLNMQFFGHYSFSLHSTPLLTERCPALSLGVLATTKNIVIGYGDNSVKVYDMEAEKATITYKVHKSRLQYIPKKLQRMHFGQVVALRCHPQKPNIFASGAWDNTLRIWDVRCSIGCIMTFEGVNICGDSIDLNYNRKGKYAIIGGSGTSCLEVINLHNRYITCSYPTTGVITALTSHEERIAFGGTSSAFSIVSFYDPKYEKDKYNIGIEPDQEHSRPVQRVFTLFHDDDAAFSSSGPSAATSVAGESPKQQKEVHLDEGKPDEVKPEDEEK